MKETSDDGVAPSPSLGCCFSLPVWRWRVVKKHQNKQEQGQKEEHEEVPQDVDVTTTAAEIEEDSAPIAIEETTMTNSTTDAAGAATTDDEEDEEDEEEGSSSLQVVKKSSASEKGEQEAEVKENGVVVVSPSADDDDGGEGLSMGEDANDAVLPQTPDETSVEEQLNGEQSNGEQSNEDDEQQTQLVAAKSSSQPPPAASPPPVMLEYNNFTEWLQTTTTSMAGNNNKKTTLEQQIEYSMHLADVAFGGGNDSTPIMTETPKAAAAPPPLLNNRARDRVCALQSAPVPTNKNDLVSWKGIHVGWFRTSFQNHPYMKLLCDHETELWFVRKVCVVEMIGRADPSILSGAFVDHIDMVAKTFGLDMPPGSADKEIVGKPTTFISYTGAYRFGDVMDVFEQLEDDEYVWMDIFCVDQFAWTGKTAEKSHEMNEFKDSLVQNLQREIKAIGKVALILQEWANCNRTLLAIWVLWEIYNTCQVGADFQILFPTRQGVDFVEKCLENDTEFEAVMEALLQVDAKKATADDDVDRQAILREMANSHMKKASPDIPAEFKPFLDAKVKELPSSVVNQQTDLFGTARMQQRKAFSPLHRVNVMVANQLRRWLIEQGLQRLEASRQQAVADGEGAQEEGGPSYIFLTNMGLLYMSNGELDKAEPLLEEAVKMLPSQDNRSTIRSMTALAELRETKGNGSKVVDAKNLYTKILSLCKSLFGDEGMETLVAMNNSARVLYTLAQFYSQAQRKKFVEEAEQLFRQALEVHEKQLEGKGDDQRTFEHLLCMNDFGALLTALGQVDEAARLTNKARNGWRNMLGEKHPRTLSAAHNNAMSKLAQGNMYAGKGDRNQGLRCIDMANYGLRDVLVGRREVLGDLHVDTLATMHGLARTYHIKGYGESAKNSWTEAESLYREALAGREQVLGKKNPDTRATRAQLNDLLSELAKIQKAEQARLDRKIESQRKTLEELRETLGETKKTTIRCMSNLSDTLYHRHKGVVPEAKELWEKALAMAIEEYGPEDELVKDLTQPFWLQRFREKDDNSYDSDALGNVKYNGAAPAFTKTLL